MQKGILELLCDLDSVEISCLSCSHNNSEVYKSVKIIRPHGPVCDQQPTLSDLVNKHKELYPDSLLRDRLCNITEVVLFAYDANENGVQAGTLDCVKPGGLVDRLMSYNRDLRVIVFNWLKLLNFPDLLNSNVHEVLNVGIDVHNQNKRLLDDGIQLSGSSRLVFPVFPSQLVHNLCSTNPVDFYVIVTFVSHSTLKCGDFLQKCQSCIEEMKNNGKNIHWEVYYGTGCKSTKKLRLQKYRNQSNVSRILC